MADKNLAFLVIGHQGYIRHIEDENAYGLENDILFSSISQTYLPLLDMLHRLESENLSFRISLVLSPTLCELLADPIVQQQYIEWLDKKICLGEKELVRCAENPELLKNVKNCLLKAKKNKEDFTEKYNQNLLKEFSDFAQKGFLELLATCGTYTFLPHYSDMREVLNAQVEAGLYSHRRFFGTAPDGFWLPFMGYAKGIEEVLAAYGLSYTIIDSNGFFLGKPVPKKGIFAPVRFEGTSSLVLFTQDAETPEDIIGENGFMRNPVYLDGKKDIGFELSAGDLTDFIAEGAARIPTGFCYWAKKDDSCAVYDPDAAMAQVKADAEKFVKAKKEKLSKAHEILKENVSLVCTVDAEVLGREWVEGIDWLENVIRNSISGEDKIELTGCGSLLGDRYSLEKVAPYPSAAFGGAYGEDLLDSTNNWMLRYTRKMSERMIDLSDRFPTDTGLKIRLLNLGAKELMLAQSCEWAMMIHRGVFPDYAAERFKESIKSFMIVFDALGSNTVSTEWLTKLEKKHVLFPWMNFRIFSKKR